MTYSGIFIRDEIGQTPETKATCWTNSPDIVCTGTGILENPEELLDREKYNAGQPSNNIQTPNQYNHVYVRGINKTNGSQTSTIYLYYVDTSIVLWPQNWRDDNIFLHEPEDKQNWVELNANAQDEIVGTRTPFVWEPPKTNNHYCLVAWVKDGSDQKTPPDRNSIGTVNDMGKFILDHHNIGWRNTVEVDSKTTSTIRGSCKIEGPAEGGNINLGVQCYNLPIDGQIGFSILGPTRETTITVPNIKIPNPGYASSVTVDWPVGINGKGLDGNIEFTYTKGATNPPDGAKLTPFSGTYGAGTNLIKRAKSIAPYRLAKVHNYGTIDDAIDNGFEIPTSIPRMFMIGSVPHKLV
jgi:hypothetical protein